MWKRIAKRRYTRTLAALSAGNVDAVLEQFAPDVRFVFVGDSSLGTELGSKEDVRRWFGRLLRLLPNARFDPQEVLIDGRPWDVRIAARVLIHSVVAGEPYTNQFAQFLRLRRGRVVWDYVLEDTPSSSSGRRRGWRRPAWRKRSLRRLASHTASTHRALRAGRGTSCHDNRRAPEVVDLDRATQHALALKEQMPDWSSCLATIRPQLSTCY